MKQLGLIRLGQVPYGQALALQLQLREELQRSSEGGLAGHVVCLEHPPVVTLGKRGKETDLISPALLGERGVELFRVDRGGEATYHGPGQLVIYPIIRLKEFDFGVVDLIRGLAGCLSDVLADYGVQTSYDPDHPGVWTEEKPRRKVASVGMRVSGGVTTHGAAVNLLNDMIPFSYIVACGMPNAPLTRLRDYVDTEFRLEEFREKFLERFQAFLGVDFVTEEIALPPRDEWIVPLPLDGPV